MNWIESLMNLLINLVPLRLVRSNEQGVLEFCGRFWKTLGPGVYPHVKFFLEVDAETVTEQGVDCPNQIITSKDAKKLSVSVNVTFRVRDAGIKHLNAQDVDRLLGLEAMRFVARVMRRFTFAEIMQGQDLLEARIIRRLRRRGAEWGLEVTGAGMTHFAESRPIHLLNDNSYVAKAGNG